MFDFKQSQFRFLPYLRTMKKTIAILGALAVVLGAFGAHTLKEVLEPSTLTSYQTGVQYHLLHTVALLALINKPKHLWTQRLWIAGIVLFSGSIYLLSLDELLGMNLSFLGPITPLGGVAFIAGWLMLLRGTVKE